ncbi:MAG TPA: UDP-N-acetylglucosamine 1-carboxyvinyltransferase [Candidatus Megaira endosymbiont of Hartmannula sinica]|nr:UDP-N-acetylglucosamine 1-carboxyvinyltransferase [Candidatus Megaera endosymbiont of Hartmannula sinica]
MDSIIVEGGKKLKGSIYTQGAKNSSLPIMAACLMIDGEVRLNNTPLLSDVSTMMSLLRTLGCKIKPSTTKPTSIFDAGKTFHITSTNITSLKAPYETVSKMRASIWVLGALVGRFGRAKVSMPGGCSIGSRMIDMHIEALEAMNISISIDNGYIKAKAKNEDRKPQACKFTFRKKSVGATINAILTATLAKEGSITTLDNCAIEPEIIDLCHFLNKFGAKIENIGKSKVIITGVQKLKPKSNKPDDKSYSIIPDRVEAFTYMIAAAITKGSISVHGISPNLLVNPIYKLAETGSNISILDGDNKKIFYINRDNYDQNIIENNISMDIKSNHEEFIITVTNNDNKIFPVSISTSSHPGFPTDMAAQFMALMTIADSDDINDKKNESTFKENIFENRLMHVPELARMGANIKILNNHTAIVKGIGGTSELSGAEVMASDLRASVTLILAGLAAKGKTKVSRVYHLDRGYFALEKKLISCGAVVKRVKESKV